MGGLANHSDDTARAKDVDVPTHTGDAGLEYTAKPASDGGSVLTQSHVGKGKWYHAGGHLATTIATPAAYAPLPWSFAQLSWSGGVISLAAGTLVTYYNSILLSSLHELDGCRFTRYRDLAKHVFGPFGLMATMFFQQIASIGNNVAIQIVAGQSAKRIYQLYVPDGKMTVQEFIIIFGIFELLISQLPSIHSLRGLNMFCTMCTIAFSICCLVLSIYSGYKIDRSTVGYSTKDVPDYYPPFNALSALGTVAFTFGDTVLPEVQATVMQPVKRNMYKGVTLCYAIIGTTYFAVSVAGYWAFGNQANPWLPYNFAGVGKNGHTLVPSGARLLVELLAIWQIVGCFQIYCRPTYEVFEIRWMKHNQTLMSPHNILVRLFVTTVYNVLMTTLCCMLPFFIDFVALVGAIGFTPLDFIVPVILYLKVRKPAWWIYGMNSVIIGVYTVVGIVGAVGAMRFVALHASTYSVFADVSV